MRRMQSSRAGLEPALRDGGVDGASSDTDGGVASSAPRPSLLHRRATDDGASKRRLRLPPGVNPLIACIAVGLLWEAYVVIFKPPPYMIPSPIAILRQLARQHSLLTHQGVITAEVVISGYILAILASIPLAIGIAYVRVVNRFFYPLLIILQVIPKISLAPLLVIWFGFGYEPKLLITFLLCFFPIVVDAVSGFKSIDPEVMELARSTGAGTMLLFWKIRLPNALPYIFTGLKVSATMATTAAVVAEFVASDKGLGYLLLQANGNLDTTLVLADILVLGFMGLLLYFLIEMLERVVIPWHTNKQFKAIGSM